MLTLILTIWNVLNTLIGIIAFGVHHMDLVSLVVGFVAGCVVCVVVPAVYNWVKKQVTSVEAKATGVANTVQGVVNSVSNTVNKL